MFTGMIGAGLFGVVIMTAVSNSAEGGWPRQMSGQLLRQPIQVLLDTDIGDSVDDT